MQEIFTDKDGNPLEKGVLYDLPPLSWPLSFQSYEYRQEGDFKNPEAVFWDFRGIPHYLNRKKTELIATKTTLEGVKNYISSAKSLVEWLSMKESKIAQRQAKCRVRVLEERDEGPLGPHPFKKDDGFVHPNKKY